MALQPIIFSDIDGTLIDFRTYSLAETETAVAEVLSAGIPLVLCSSKTRTEQIPYLEKLQIPDPFIVENGSAIFVPSGYFPFPLSGARAVGEYEVIELGVPAGAIREAVAAVRTETAVSFQGYHDLSVAEVSAVTGLDEAAAARARQREYSETIVTPLPPPVRQQLREAFATRGLALVSGGKFHTVTGAQSDKGTAVRRLTALFQRRYGRVTTIGLGDSANDAPLLAAVERPYLVQKPGGTWQEVGDLPVSRVPAVGPAGWRQVASMLLSDLR